MAPAIPDGLERLPVGSVTERRQDGRTFLVVQETPESATIIESWEDGLDLVIRLLRRMNQTLEEMTLQNSALNERLDAGLRDTNAKIVANQKLLDELIKGSP